MATTEKAATATKGKSSKAKKSAKKTSALKRKSLATKTAQLKPQSVQVPRGKDPNLLAGTPGPGPKVGDSAYQSPQEDAKSKHRPTSDSPGTHAGSEAPRAAKKASIPHKAVICDDIVWVTDGRNPGKCRPGKVLRVTDPEAEGAENSPIDLVGFTDSGKFPNNDHLPAVVTREGVRYSEGLEPGTWHWPEDNEDLLEKQAKSARLALDQQAVEQAANRS